MTHHNRVLMQLVLVIALSIGATSPLAPIRPPPYAAGYLCARPSYHDGRSWIPGQPWYYLPRPVLEHRRRRPLP